MIQVEKKEFKKWNDASFREDKISLAVFREDKPSVSIYNHGYATHGSKKSISITEREFLNNDEYIALSTLDIADVTKWPFKCTLFIRTDSIISVGPKNRVKVKAGGCLEFKLNDSGMYKILSKKGGD